MRGGPASRQLPSCGSGCCSPRCCCAWTVRPVLQPGVSGCRAGHLQPRQLSRAVSVAARAGRGRRASRRAWSGSALAVFVTRPAGRDFRPMVNALATIGQTFPPAAVLAIAVPMRRLRRRGRPSSRCFSTACCRSSKMRSPGWKGCRRRCARRPRAWGCRPGRGCAMSDLPLAAPVILAGIRVSVTIAIGTATIGSTVGALTLGTPIFDGLVANKLPFRDRGRGARRALRDSHRYAVCPPRTMAAADSGLTLSGSDRRECRR